MALDPPPLPEIAIDTRETDLPQALVAKVEARKKKSKRRKKTNRRVNPSLHVQEVPREIVGPSEYMSNEGLSKVYERRRSRGVSRRPPVTITEYLEATEWTIPRVLVHRSRRPKQGAKRTTRAGLKRSDDDYKKSSSHSNGISDITPFDAYVTRRKDKRRGPLVLSPIETTSEDQRRDSSVRGENFQQEKPHVFLGKYAEEEGRIERPRDRLERLVQLHEKLERPQTQVTIAKAQQKTERRHRKEPRNIWDLFEADASYDVSLAGSPPPPSKMSGCHSSNTSSSQSASTSYPQSEPTLDISDFDESSKPLTSQQRLELVKKADKELLDRLMREDSQKPPVDYVL